MNMSFTRHFSVKVDTYSIRSLILTQMSFQFQRSQRFKIQSETVKKLQKQHTISGILLTAYVCNNGFVIETFLTIVTFKIHTIGVIPFSISLSIRSL